MSNNKPSPPALILRLPNEILLDILSRIPLDTLSHIPFVCRRFSNLVNDPNFLPLHLLPRLYLFSFSPSGFFSSSSKPLTNSHSELEWDRDSVPKGLEWNNVRGLYLPFKESAVYIRNYHRFPSARQPLPKQLPYYKFSLVSLGHSIYILGNQLAICYNTLTKTVAPVAPTVVPHERMATAAVDGKIYVAGGRRTAVEEYDPRANKWSIVSEAPVARHGCIGAGAAGIFYFIDTVRAGSMDAYDVSAGKWVKDMPAPLPGDGYVVGACATPAGHVYIISSHEVGLRFWRWAGRGEEWTRLEAPVVYEREGLVRRGVRFGCVAVRDDSVVATMNVSPRWGCGWIARAVLVYNVVSGKWCQGPELPLDFYSESALVFTQGQAS